MDPPETWERLSRPKPLFNTRLFAMFSFRAALFPISSKPAELRVKVLPVPILVPRTVAELSSLRMLPISRPVIVPAFKSVFPPEPACPEPLNITMPWLTVRPLCELVPVNRRVLVPTFVSMFAPLTVPERVKLPPAVIPLRALM
jgi:hypothetical protein